MFTLGSNSSFIDFVPSAVKGIKYEALIVSKDVFYSVFLLLHVDGSGILTPLLAEQHERWPDRPARSAGEAKQTCAPAVLRPAGAAPKA